MENIAMFIVMFLMLYLVYFLTVLTSNKKIEKFKSGTQFMYFKNIYKLDPQFIDMKKFVNDISISNSFIISLTVIVVDYTDKLIIKMIAGFLILIPLIAFFYHFIGRKYQKKMNKFKEEKHV